MRASGRFERPFPPQVEDRAVAGGLGQAFTPGQRWDSSLLHSLSLFQRAFALVRRIVATH
jgi:hypothetical protein